MAKLAEPGKKKEITISDFFVELRCRFDESVPAEIRQIAGEIRDKKLVIDIGETLSKMNDQVWKRSSIKPAKPVNAYSLSARMSSYLNENYISFDEFYATLEAMQAKSISDPPGTMAGTTS